MWSARGLVGGWVCELRCFCSSCGAFLSLSSVRQRGGRVGFVSVMCRKSCGYSCAVIDVARGAVRIVRRVCAMVSLSTVFLERGEVRCARDFSWCWC